MKPQILFLFSILCFAISSHASNPMYVLEFTNGSTSAIYRTDQLCRDEVMFRAIAIAVAQPEYSGLPRNQYGQPVFVLAGYQIQTSQNKRVSVAVNFKGMPTIDVTTEVSAYGNCYEKGGSVEQMQ